MRKRRKSMIVMILALSLIISSVFGSDNMRTLKTRIAEILDKFPAQNAEGRDQLASEIVRLGPKGIQEICRMLVPPETGSDTTVRFALNGTATYVNRKGADKEREMYAKAIIKALESETDNEVKAFLIRQLQLAGKKESVKALSKFLNHRRLCEPAAQALLGIRSSHAEKALLKSLDKAYGANRITIIKALGEMRSSDGVKKITRYVESRDEELRQVALYALANIGDAESEKVLDKGTIAASPYERAKAPSLYLLYAQRLAESGRRVQCMRICRNLIKYYTARHESHVQCTALSILAKALGKDVFEYLLDAMNNPNKEFRWRALELADVIPGEEATARWIYKLGEVPAEIQAEIITMLGQRDDKTALPILLQAFKNEEKVVRLAAIPAASQLGDSNILEDLISLLPTCEEDEALLVKQALLSLPGNQVVPEAARVLEEMPSPARVALIEILSERHAGEHVDMVLAQAMSEDEKVRRAALTGLEHLVSENDLARLIDILLSATDRKEIAPLQNAIVASANLIPDPERRANQLLDAMEKTSGSKHNDLMRILARIGGEKALQTVKTEIHNQDPKIQAVAVYTLVNWLDLSATDELLDICLRTTNRKYIYLALQGYLRLVSEADITPDKKFDMIKEALNIPTQKEERNLILSALANAKTHESLKLVATYFDDTDLKQRAARVAARIALPQIEAEGLTGFEVVSVLKRAIGFLENRFQQKEVAKYIGILLEQEGFIPFFNGKDLSGWKGLVGDPISRAMMTAEELRKAQAEADSVMQAHWKVVDGILVFDGKGESLCTAKDYEDFELLVDWKIEKEGDSGIYLRGFPQVQIWDPEQWPEGSGGLYNNKKGPNKPLICVDKPIGEWNTFRIKMIGERVTVYLNDVLVVDDVVMENYWERDKPIYPTGQIELQSHNSPLYFRNIYFREIIH